MNSHISILIHGFDHEPHLKLENIHTVMLLIRLINIEWSSGFNLCLHLSLFVLFQGNLEEFYSFVPLAGAVQTHRPPSAGKIVHHME